MKKIVDQHIRKTYDEIFNKDPLAANVYLLMTELRDENDEVHLEVSSKKEFIESIRSLTLARFNNPREYQLGKEE